MAIFFSHAFPQHLLFLSLSYLNVLSLVTSPYLSFSSDSNFLFSFLLHPAPHFFFSLLFRTLSQASPSFLLKADDCPPGKALMLSQASISPGPHCGFTHLYLLVQCDAHYFFSFCLALEHISCFRSTPAPCH